MHTIICGATETGKTTLARAMAQKFADENQPIIVYDPVSRTQTMAGGWPEAAKVFGDEEECMDYLARDDVHNAHVFIDEAGDIFPLAKKHNMWLLTRGRHFGFSVILICQRPKMAAPSARTQCSVGYFFKLSPDDMRDIFADFGHGPPKDEKELDTGDFFCLHSGQAGIKRANIFDILKKG